MKTLFLFLLLFPFISFSQNLEQRKNAQKNIVLIKNDSILPIKNLEKQKIGLILDPKQDLSIFLKYLKKYTHIEVADDNNYKKYNFLIICNPKFSFKNKSQTWLYCHFSNKKIPRKSRFSDAILISPSQKLEQELAAQIVFGAIEVSGKLAKKQRKFPKNSGISLNGGLRLAYTIPQEVGMDSLKLYTKIDSIAKLALDSQAAAGFQILVARNGKIILEKYYGFHTYEKKQAVQAENLYDLASITKISTALPLAMRLYEQNLLDLDKNIGQYLPFLKNSNKDSLTFREILTHQAGLKEGILFWKHTLNEKGKLKENLYSKKLYQNFTLQVSDSMFLDKNFYDSVFQKIKDSPLLPKQYRYSDLGLCLLMQAIKNLQNNKFEEILYQDFYKKIGANSLLFNPLQYYDKNNIVPTEMDTIFRKRLVWGYVHDETAAVLGGISGNAGLFGNANDLAKLMQMYLNKGEYGGEQFFKKSTIEEFTKYQFYPNSRRALGFDKPMIIWDKNSIVSRYVSPKSFGHSGFTGTFTWADPKTGLLFVFLSNRVYPFRSQQNLFRFSIRPAIHDVLYESILD